MSVQVKHRRDTAANIAGFTPAQGELIVDTTNNRVIVGDGTTVGGWAAAKLSEIGGRARTPVADTNYAALITDRNIAFTAITAARTVTLPTAANYPQGTRLTVFDESGAVSATNSITLTRAGSDTINGATSAILASAYGVLAVETNGVSKWTVTDQSPSGLPAVGIGTSADPLNPLSVYGASALFNGANFSFTINKSAPTNTASLLFQDGFSARAQIGLLGSDNFSFKVSPNGSTYSTALAFDAATGAPTFGNARTAVSDAAYAVLTTDREVAYTAITAARVVTLPSAASFPAGHPLVIVDEGGAVSQTNTLTVAVAGSDTISGRTSARIGTAFGFMRLVSDGVSKWTVIGRSINILALTSSATYTPTPGMTYADVYIYGAGGGAGGGALQATLTAVSGGGGGGGGGAGSISLTAAAIGTSQPVNVGATGTGGAAATTASTAGGNGGQGGSSSFFGFVAFGGGGGSGGQLGAVSAGGGGGSFGFGSGGNASGSTPGNSAGYLNGYGGTGASGGNIITPSTLGAGGAGAPIAGSSSGGGYAINNGGGGGGPGGSITASNTLIQGYYGGIGNAPTNAGAPGSGAGGGGTMNTLANAPVNSMQSGGGAGGASGLATGFAGGAGGTAAGGGGGGGSAQNGGTAGGGGAGGGGLVIIVEYFS